MMENLWANGILHHPFRWKPDFTGPSTSTHKKKKKPAQGGFSESSTLPSRLQDPNVLTASDVQKDTSPARRRRQVFF